MSHQKNITTDSWIEVSARSQAKETVRPDVEESKKYPCLAACASLRRLPSLLAMTHVVVADTVGIRAQSAHCVVFCVGGLSAWPIDGARTRLWSRS